jgi:hypothetical protein
LKTIPVIRYVSGSDSSSCEGVNEDDELSVECGNASSPDAPTPDMPDITQASAVPLVQSAYDSKEAVKAGAALTLASMALQRRPSVTLPEVSMLAPPPPPQPMGGGRCRMTSINTIASFDVSEFALLLEEEDRTQQQASPAEVNATIASYGKSANTSKNPLRSSFYESSGLLAQALDMFQEGQTSFESFLGLGDSKIQPKWEVSL